MNSTQAPRLVLADAAAFAKSLSLLGARVHENRGMLEDGAVAHGVFHVHQLVPHASDRRAVVRFRSMIAGLEAKALLSRIQSQRIDLLGRAGEIEHELAKITMRKMYEEEVPNVVTTVGKNLALDTYLAGSAYTVTGPFGILIGAASYTTGPVVGDTMTSHAGWTEAGSTNAPTYTSPRKTASWSAASAGSKALASAMGYGITGTGTAKGIALGFGTGAVSTIDNTGGTLYSAGTFTDQPVVSGNTLNVSYTASL